jgi:hypothetical protein
MTPPNLIVSLQQVYGMSQAGDASPEPNEFAACAKHGKSIKSM